MPNQSQLLRRVTEYVVTHTDKDGQSCRPSAEEWIEITPDGGAAHPSHQPRPPLRVRLLGAGQAARGRVQSVRERLVPGALRDLLTLRRAALSGAREVG